MQVQPTSLPGVLLLRPDRHVDERGFFSEAWNAETLAQHGITVEFVQDNHSFSPQPGTLRGLHYQAPPHAQAKLVRCARGALFDVAVDLRPGSATFGRWTGVDLSFDNGWQMLIPEGFAHGFVTRLPETEIAYKCSAHYAPECEHTLHFADPEIGIEWGIDLDRVLISERDAAAPRLSGLSPLRVEECVA